MYVSPNYKSKADVKRALAKGETITVFSPGPFPCPQDGNVSVEGPHYPMPHRWYGSATVKDGKVVSIK